MVKLTKKSEKKLKPITPKLDVIENQEVPKPKTPFKLDVWQEEVLAAEGNLCICSGRQVGKSQIIAIKTAEYIIHNPKKKILIISVTEDQAINLLVKVMLYLTDNYRNQISKGKDKPTQHRVCLKNGSMIITKALGAYATGVLGLTVDICVADECAYLPSAIWQSITPMLLTTGGCIWLLSTPAACSGYFYEAYTNRSMNFQTFHVNSEEVAAARPEPQRTMMLNYLAREQARMTKLEYAQQYLAQFLEEQSQLFSDDLINCSQQVERIRGERNGVYYLGVDVARMGSDESTFEVFEKLGDILIQREHIVTTKTLTTATVNEIIELDSEYDFKKIYIDDGGLGVAVFDQLLLNENTKRKVVAINNASRPLDKDKKRTKKLLKEDLYFNLKRLMERAQIKLLKDSDIFTSLKSIVYEHDNQKVKIHGRYSHITEGIIRAAWSVREQRLELFYECA